MNTLGTRLAACAAYVRQGGRVADIGTDHALLPVWLIKNGRALSAVASDIAPLPLERAKLNIKKNRLEDKIKTVLAPGLEGIQPGECDHIIIAGMGGDVIVSVLSAADWLPAEGMRLIVQPMSRMPLVRKYLLAHGWRLADETPVIDCGRAYSVMLFEPGENDLTDEKDIYTGRLPSRPCEASDRIYKKEAGILRDMSEGAQGEEKDRLLRLADEIEYMKGKKQ